MFSASNVPSAGSDSATGTWLTWIMSRAEPFFVDVATCHDTTSSFSFYWNSNLQITTKHHCLLHIQSNLFSHWQCWTSLLKIDSSAWLFQLSWCFFPTPSSWTEELSTFNTLYSHCQVLCRLHKVLSCATLPSNGLVWICAFVKAGASCKFSFYFYIHAPAWPVGLWGFVP